MSDLLKVKVGGSSYLCKWEYNPVRVHQSHNVPSNDIGIDGDYFLQVNKVAIGTDLGNIIPVQVDANGGAIGSTNIMSPYYPWKAFDGLEDGENYWSSSLYATDAWVGFDFGAGNEKAIKAISIKPRVWSSNRQLTNFIVQASNDNTLWINISSGYIPTGSTVSWFGFSFSNNITYRYWRIYCYNRENSATYTIYEIHMTENPIDASYTSSLLNTYNKRAGEWVKVS